MRSRPRRGIRVGLLLLGVAALPLGGLVFLAAQLLVQLESSQDDVVELGRAADELLAVVTLQSAVIDEQTYSQAAAVAGHMGITDEIVSSFLRYDIAAARRDARQRVDELLAEVDLPEVDRAVAGAREELEAGDGIALLAYDPALRALSERLDAARFEVSQTATVVTGGRELAAAVQVFAARTARRDALADMVNAYYRLQLLAPRERGTAHLDMIESRARHQRSEDQLERLGRFQRSDSGGRAASDGADPGPTEELLVRIDEAVATGPEPGGGIDDLSLTTLLDHAATFPLAEAATRQHIDEVLAAAADVDALADTARERAATVARGVLLGTAAVAVATAASLWVVRRAIVSPLRDLAVATDALRRGGDLHHVPLRGPSEVRTAAAALNEATDGLRRVEEQALALADGRLADPSLGATVSGPLGASVSLAVDRLRGSLAEQEVFRRRLAHEATHDALTGLPNRAASLDHLRAALARVQRADTNLAVLFVDLDRFKSVNDRDGHAAGDAVLREVARRLAEGCRGGDVVGRLGGDEFLVIAESVADAAGARQLADRLVDSLLAGRPATIGASIGIAVSRPDISADELVHAADVALYRAKSAGGHRSELHGPDPTTVGDDRAPAI